MALLVYTLQFRKACADSTPYQCIMETWQWAGQGKLTPRDTSSKTPIALTTPPQQAPRPPETSRNDVKTPPAGPVRNTGLPSGTDHLDRNIMIVNSGDDVLDFFHATDCNVKDWGRDRLGKSYIDKGRGQTFDLDDGSGSCCYDLRVKFRGGEQKTRWNVDICKVATWTVSNK